MVTTQKNSLTEPDTAHKIFVGNNMRLAIMALGLSQAEFARRTNIGPNKLHNYLRGANYPEARWLTAVCDQFSLTLDFIYRGKLDALPYALAIRLQAHLEGHSTKMHNG